MTCIDSEPLVRAKSSPILCEINFNCAMKSLKVKDFVYEAMMKQF